MHWQVLRVLHRNHAALPVLRHMEDDGVRVNVHLPGIEQGLPQHEVAHRGELVRLDGVSAQGQYLLWVLEVPSVLFQEHLADQTVRTPLYCSLTISLIVNTFLLLDALR